MIHTNEELIRYLRERGILQSERIEQALALADRSNFVPKNQALFAYADKPLPIGKGQTISQPSTVVIMLELLNVKKGNKILDIGAGSGWTTAILSFLAGDKGKVFGWEILKEIGRFGLGNIKKLNRKNISYEIGDFAKGGLENAPYDRILSGASFNEFPNDIIKMLKDGGIAVFPTKDYNLNIIKKEGGEIKLDKKFGFTFVPITH